MGRLRKLSDEQLDEMAALRERGWGVDRIAEHFTQAGTPISASAINWQCMRVGADAPARLRGRTPQRRTEPVRRAGHIVRPFSADEDALLRVLRLQGFKVGVIAKRLGRKENSIRGRLLTLARHDARAEDTQA